MVRELDFMGIDLYEFMDNPFFKEHDYNEIIALETEDKIYTGSTISDYLNIHEVPSSGR